jgi:hypothetical protein
MALMKVVRVDEKPNSKLIEGNVWCARIDSTM